MTLKYFDAHTHLNMLGSGWSEAGQRAFEAGVSLVNVGADVESSRLALEQVKELGDACWSTVGIHPTEDNGGLASIASISELARDEKVVAIGECGLEYFRLPDFAKSSVVAKQKELFKKHIDLALEVGKPLMIHCRASENTKDAYDDLYEILRDYKKRVGERLRFNLHFFTSDWETAKKFLDLGGYLSFPGVITFSNQYDEVVKNAPLDRIMSETDAPFATPEPVRAKAGSAHIPNEPAYVSYVAERICALRPEPREQVLEALVVNATRFYGLK